jgi:hypothetical protein
MGKPTFDLLYGERRSDPALALQGVLEGIKP